MKIAIFSQDGNKIILTEQIERSKNEVYAITIGGLPLLIGKYQSEARTMSVISAIWNVVEKCSVEYTDGLFEVTPKYKMPVV